MPILRIPIDNEEVEFTIIPLNRKIQFSLLNRYKTKDEIINRPGFLSHVVKSPKMSQKEWAELPVSIITRIMRAVDYYTESVFYKERELRTLYMQIRIFEDELDDAFRYLGDVSDDWVWNRVKSLEKTIDEKKEKIKKIEKSLEYLKSDKVIFEEGKEIDYDVQPLQLENS